MNHLKIGWIHCKAMTVTPHLLFGGIPQGWPTIAHRFIGGWTTVCGSSPVRDGRIWVPRIQDFSFALGRALICLPPINCWAVFSPWASFGVRLSFLALWVSAVK